jgi:hypothetical protein
MEDQICERINVELMVGDCGAGSRLCSLIHTSHALSENEVQHVSSKAVLMYKIQKIM